MEKDVVCFVHVYNHHQHPPHPGMWAMEYYSIMRKKEILLFGTKWMEFEGIMLNEIRLTKTNSYR